MLTLDVVISLSVSVVQIEVCLLDHNDSEVVTADRVFKLPPEYNQLPYQVRYVICAL